MRYYLDTTPGVRNHTFKIKMYKFISSGNSYGLLCILMVKDVSLR